MTSATSACSKAWHAHETRHDGPRRRSARLRLAIRELVAPLCSHGRHGRPGLWHTTTDARYRLYRCRSARPFTRTLRRRSGARLHGSGAVFAGLGRPGCRNAPCQVPVWLVSPRGPRSLKLLAGRPRDIADVGDILFTQGQLDEAYLRLWARQLGVLDPLEKILSEHPPI